VNQKEYLIIEWDIVTNCHSLTALYVRSLYTVLWAVDLRS